MHHLLDPSIGRPVFTGLVSVTALAPRAVRAEALAKAALLSGPDAAARVLSRHGGIAFDDAGVEHRFGALAVPVRRRCASPERLRRSRGGSHPPASALGPRAARLAPGLPARPVPERARCSSRSPRGSSAKLIDGAAHDVSRAVFTAALATWAVLELVRGSNWVRRVLGAVVLASIVVGLVRSLG